MATRRRILSRRTMLVGCGGLLGCCVVAGGGTAAWVYFGNDPISNIGQLAFNNRLAIPPLLEPEIDENGRKTWELTIQAGETRIVPEGPASTWGINGPLLAPTLRATRGDEVAIALHNELPEETTIHWHGMHLPAIMDGGPHQLIATGDTWHPTWTIDQPAATLWYHPHPHGSTADHVYRGVTGLFLLDDDESARLQIPRDYGIDDVPLIIQDKKFTGDGNLSFEEASFVQSLTGAGAFGILGDTILVNGTYDPVFEVSRTLTRFRLLNGSNARFYNLGFTDNRPFQLIATENGFVAEEPPALTRVLIGPGERAEIVVDFADGDDVILRSYEQDLASEGFGSPIGADDTFDIIKLRAVDQLEPSPPMSVPLRESNDAAPVPEGATTRSFRLEGHGSINGKKMDMNRIDFVIPAGALETWEVETSAQPHTFHIHGATFHVLSVDGAEPPTHLRGPKDTVLIARDRPVHLAVQFDSYTDPEMPYMFHCHILKHEDNGMMGQFVVVEPGTEDSAAMTLTGSGHDGGDHH